MHACKVVSHARPHPLQANGEGLVKPMHTICANCSGFCTKQLGPIRLQYVLTWQYSTPVHICVPWLLKQLWWLVLKGRGLERLWRTQRCYPVVCRPQRHVRTSSYREKANLCAILAASWSLDVRLSDHALAILVKQQVLLFSKVAPQLGQDLWHGSPSTQ